MKRKAIFDAVWTTPAWLDPAYFEFDGITFGEPEFLAIEAQERFELIVRGHASSHLNHLNGNITSYHDVMYARRIRGFPPEVNRRTIKHVMYRRSTS
jgi:hypothetical protein